MISLLTGMGPQTLYSLRFWLIQSLHLKRKSHVVTVKNPSLCSNRYFTEKSSLPHPKIVESWGGGGYFPPVFQLNKIFFSYILTEYSRAISENHHLLWLLWLEECNWRTRENCHFFKLPLLLFMPIYPVFLIDKLLLTTQTRLLHIISLVYHASSMAGAHYSKEEEEAELLCIMVLCLFTSP